MNKSDIPKDVRETAEGVMDNLFSWKDIARAILAERERCSRAVDAELADAENTYVGEVRGVLRSRLKAIAAAIRRPD